MPARARRWRSRTPSCLRPAWTTRRSRWRRSSASSSCARRGRARSWRSPGATARENWRRARFPSSCETCCCRSSFRSAPGRRGASPPSASTRPRWRCRPEFEGDSPAAGQVLFSRPTGVTDMNTYQVRLTSLAHGGGCGCKLAPSVLQELLADQPAAAVYKQLLVGTETSDDAAVWQVDDNTCIIATTDFFMPMVDDPFDFGRIAATNAISDVYAMGGKPVMALAILGMPLGKIPTEMVREILKGGASVCATAGIPVAGGHSIDCPEPVYGLAVIGTCRPDQVRRYFGVHPGDPLLLTKPVGIGIYSAAIKQSVLTLK